MNAILKQSRRFLRTWIHYAASYFDILLDAAKNAPVIFKPPYSKVFLKQVYFTGIESLPFLAIAALILGFATSSQIYLVLGKDVALTMKIFRLLLVQEGAELLVALYILSRSGSAMASELANCCEHGEILSLYRLGIDPAAYLIAPRIISMALSVSALTIYFQGILVFGTIALMSFFYEWDYLLALANFAQGVDPLHSLLMVLKTMIFGAVIAGICSYQGMHAIAGPQGIPVATRTAIMHGFAGILLIDAFFTIF